MPTSCVVSLPLSCQGPRRLDLDECLGLVSASLCVWMHVVNVHGICCGSQTEAFLAQENAQDFFGLRDYFTCALVLFCGAGMQAGC